MALPFDLKSVRYSFTPSEEDRHSWWESVVVVDVSDGIALYVCRDGEWQPFYRGLAVIFN